jgi:hypothetical protein
MSKKEKPDQRRNRLDALEAAETADWVHDVRERERKRKGIQLEGEKLADKFKKRK